MATVRITEGDQLILACDVAEISSQNEFIQSLVAEAMATTDGMAERDDAEGCTVTCIVHTDSEYTHEFHECGNGYPGVGDDVIVQYDEFGNYGLARVASVSGIHTKQWQANMIYLTLKDSDTDWDDLDEVEQDKLYDSLHHVSAVSE